MSKLKNSTQHAEHLPRDKIIVLNNKYLRFQILSILLERKTSLTKYQARMILSINILMSGLALNVVMNRRRKLQSWV